MSVGAETMVRPQGLNAGTRAALLVALCGALFQAWLAFLYLPGLDPGFFGSRIYDEAWLALRAGEVDLPPRLLRFEGHYAPNGEGYLYHGAGPLLFRALLAPLVDLTEVSLAPLTIFFWTVLGTAFYHAAFHAAATVARPEGEVAGIGPRFALLLGLACWFSGPAVVLGANHALYHEPIAMAYGLTGAAIWLWQRSMAPGRQLRRALPALGFLAALCLQARPNLAVALYLATGLGVLQLLWQDRLRALLLPAVTALALLGAGVAGYLGYNALRFGEAAVSHGSFEPSQVQYGPIYWGHESPDGNRARTFIDHGRFDPARILPNGLIYLLAPPEPHAPGLYRATQRLFYAATLERLGYLRIEGPGAGMLFLWTAWAGLAGIGLWQAIFRGRGTGRGRAGGLVGAMAPMGLGVLASGALTLSYATITLRYHVDLWPLLAVPALGGIGWLAARRGVGQSGRVLVIAGLIGVSVSLAVAQHYTKSFRTEPGSFHAPWSRAHCEALVRARGHAAAHAVAGASGPAIAEAGDGVAALARICRDPRVR